MRIYLYGNSFFKIGNLGKVSGQLKFFQGQTFRNDEKLAIFCIYLKMVKKWTLELPKVTICTFYNTTYCKKSPFAPFTTLHYILLLFYCLAFWLSCFFAILLFFYLAFFYFACKVPCVLADCFLNLAFCHLAFSPLSI